MRGLIGCKKCIDAELNSLGWYIRKRAITTGSEKRRCNIVCK